MEIRSFRDLRVWQAGMELVEQVYRITRAFPAEETYGLRNQMRRASISIPSNIAEGHTREHSREFLQYISMAQGSLAELQTQLEIAVRLKYVQVEEAKEVLNLATSLAKQLHALRNALGKRRKPSSNP